ncbi:hypothetical protein BOSE62_50073 [Bosea sp. 62]|nr:hypothetical protein BOSE46_110141 [Bosea sp. 46]CAD5258218.1 hypothetical protein BOSE21B_110183 [Bosea sp. 21B]CAD5282682.1 hypothetical protein BOSE7B_41031 [Bosea sp. 7B]VVT52016.1 hypothetical protein BOS5A_110526 [Bosea sp. EC-HK365B]VXB40196.1 hypothetical protein BOSE29B_110141 [Bosea sp. 29B]VXB83677.1 hypothetical protein BOSE125_150289 [Bosea sp. 125]VXC57617.1 hypothetical protein BOSE62_50073 [Bosea sp. 62]VXC88337.1 hypothetical protein BOSE127_70075 [Bosea sp. 127]
MSGRVLTRTGATVLKMKNAGLIPERGAVLKPDPKHVKGSLKDWVRRATGLVALNFHGRT